MPQLRPSRTRSSSHRRAGNGGSRAHRGVTRVLGIVLVLAAVISALVIEAANDLLWVVIACAALLVVSLAAATAALRPASAEHDREVHSPPPQHAFLIMNPRSGGGK